MDRRTFPEDQRRRGRLDARGALHRAGRRPSTMRFAHFAKEDHPANIAAKQFASQVEKRTDGAIKINDLPQ